MHKLIFKRLLPIELLPDVAMRLLFTALRLSGPMFHGITAWILLIFLIIEKRSMLSWRRLWNLYRLCSATSLPEGCFVECGVARGGGVAMMSLAARGKRTVWGFDSFDKMPVLTAEDEGDGDEWVGHSCSGANGKQEAARTLSRFRLDSDDTHLVAGWFQDTLPQHVDRIVPIAVLRLDSDWYAATRYCLERCYEQVAVGGVIIIDDYNTFLGCRKAVDDFRAQKKIDSPLIATERGTEVYWYKMESPVAVRSAA